MTAVGSVRRIERGIAYRVRSTTPPAGGALRQFAPVLFDRMTEEALFDAAARADDGGARCVKTRVHQCAALGVGEPEHTLHDEIKSKENLDGRQNVKEYFHAKRE